MTRVLSDRQWLAQECARSREELARWLASDRAERLPQILAGSPVCIRYAAPSDVAWPACVRRSRGK